MVVTYSYIVEWKKPCTRRGKTSAMYARVATLWKCLALIFQLSYEVLFVELSVGHFECMGFPATCCDPSRYRSGNAFLIVQTGVS